MADVAISFDDDFQIRVLEADKFKETDKLREECSAFTSKIAQFNDTAKGVVQVVDAQAKKSESEKMKAIGLRNMAESEAENRKKKEYEMQSLIAERQKELARYKAEYDSLVKVEQDQKNLIDKLSNNEA